MSQDRWREIKAHFLVALERPPGEREAFIAEQCPDESVRAEVVRLLRLHHESTAFLESPIQMRDDDFLGGADPLIGRRLGDFLILRRIGAGGMGAVYEAEQEQPRRRAAVKVLRPGFTSPEMLRRFAYEAEILAKLQHPGIAHAYATGTFDLGDGAQPWFAMELIDGRSLNDHLSSHALSIEAKLELLLLICDAVQHAHQRGVIHRDLKPANILVVETDTQYSGTAARGRSDRGVQTKVLDFGVARVVDPDVHLTMHTLSAPGLAVGTLSYMSPEQLAGDPDAIDVRCDVYALGVIGYEMLAGRLPHDRRTTGIAETIRAIERDEPQRLGTIDPALRGDIEVIFAKALEKEPSRRYQSAAELAADLRRHLNDEPVLARPATALYQFRKFVRRNRPLVGGIAATILALAGGMAMYAVEAHRARTEAARSQYEADKASAINNFIVNDFLMKLLAAVHGPDSADRLPVAELVDQAAANIAPMFADQPLAEAAVRNEVASIYYNLGAFDKAAAEFRAALDGWEAHLGPDHPDTLKAVNNLGQTMAQLGGMEEAEALYRRALDGRIRALGEDDPYTLISMNNLGILLQGTDRFDEAEELLRRSLAVQERVRGTSHKETLTTMANLGTLLIRRGRPEEALRLHRTVYETSCETFGEDHMTTLIAASRFGQTLIRNDDPHEAEGVLQATVAALVRILGADHIDTIRARRVLALALSRLDRNEAAALQLRLALEAVGHRSPPDERTLRAIQRQLDALAPVEPSDPG